MITISYLSDLVPGETAFIYRVSNGGLCTRLCDLGFTSGTQVECIASAPLGGPSAYLVRGTLIAIRREDAKNVKVQRMPSASRKKTICRNKSGISSWD